MICNPSFVLFLEFTDHEVRARLRNCSLEVILKAELNGARPVRIDGVQEGVAGEAIHAARSECAGGIVRAAVTADRVAAGVAEVRIVDTELGVIEDVEGLRPKLQCAVFVNHEKLQQGHIEVQAAGIIQKIPAGIPESKPAGSDEFIGIQEKGTEAAGIRGKCRRRWILDHIGIRTSAHAVRDSRVVEHSKSTASGIVDHTERGPRLVSRDS